MIPVRKQLINALAEWGSCSGIPRSYQTRPRVAAKQEHHYRDFGSRSLALPIFGVVQLTHVKSPNFGVTMSFRLIKQLAWWIVIILPPVCFYYLLMESVSSIPFLDDYNSILSFLLHWKEDHGFQHVVRILFWQHNEYRLMFENAIVSAQYAMRGHTDIKALCILGDLFVLPIFGALLLIWKTGQASGTSTAIVFAPASYLLFQLQYYSAVNDATTSLQYLPVILFALLSCYLITRKDALSFSGALCCLALSIASSGNGFFLLPIGCIMFIQNKGYERLIVWLATGAAMSLIYFSHGYNFHKTEGGTRGLLSGFAHFSPTFAAAFLGSTGTTSRPVPAIALGILLLVVFVIATKDRLFASNPALYYSMLFFIVTAMAVSGLRSDYGAGVPTALGSRYRIFSVTMVILTYFYLAGKYRDIQWNRAFARAIPVALWITLLGFTIASDWAGEKQLLMKRQRLEFALMRWYRHEPPLPMTSEGADDYTARMASLGFFEPIEPTLSSSIHEGIYRLPQLPGQH
jgi:hypothetical protein